MKITSTGAGARGNYYDRNPLAQTIKYSAGFIAPAGLTIRATYTVPTGRKAIVDSINAMAFRDTVATTVGRTQGEVRYTPQAGGVVRLAEADLYNIAQGTIDRVAVGSQGVLLVGDVCDVATNDASVGGSVTYDLTAKIFEFDA